MQNAGPVSSCSRESWMRQSRRCSAASSASDEKNSFKSQEKPWGNIRTSDGFYGLQTNSRSKLAEFDPEQEQDQLLHGNMQENMVTASLAWSAAYSSIGGDGFCQGFSVKAAERDVADSETARLLNMRNADVSPQEFNFQAPGSLCGHVQPSSPGSLHSGYGLKMEKISRSNGVSVQTSSAAPSLQRPHLISFSANSADMVKDSAAGDDLSQSFSGRTDKCEETAEHKRTSSALEDGEQGGSAKRNRTSDAPSKFKVQVRKEKLGERITALQQLVSPFGKTDTASVLLEAIGYIKFLQDQVQVLSTPYIKGFPSSQAQDGKGGDSAVSNLRGRGLCLMPISSTQLMANDNGADYWASGIGGGARF